MPTLTKDGQTIVASTPDELSDALAQGFTTATGTVPLVKPGGGVTDVPIERAQRFLGLGFGVEAPISQIATEREAKLEADLGGLGGQIETAGAAGARVLTGGLSDIALKNVPGTDAARLRNLRQVNPKADIAGTVAGVGLGLAGSGGTGILSGAGSGARGALSVTPASLALRAGRNITARGAGRGALTRAGAAAAGAGVEGAFFSTGNYISEVALENKELTGEGFVGSMGKGALFGAGLGGGLSLLGSASRAGLEGSRRLLNKADDLAKRAAEGKPDTLLRKIFRKKDQTPAKVAEAEQSFLNTLDDQDDKIARLLSDADDEIARRGVAEAAELQRRTEALRASQGRVAAWQARIKESIKRPKGELPGTTTGLLGRASRGAEAGRVFGRAKQARIAPAVTSDLASVREGIQAVGQMERAAFETTEEFLRLVDNVPGPPGITLNSAGRVADDFKDYAAAVERQTGQGSLAGARLGGQGPGAKALLREAAGETAETGASRLLDNPLVQAAGTAVGFGAFGDVPVIGPVLASYLLWRGRMGKIGGISKLLSSAKGGPMVAIAEKTTALRNKLDDAVEGFIKQGGKVTKKVKPVTVPTATALSAPLFDSGKEVAQKIPRLKVATERQKELTLFKQRVAELEEAVANPDEVEERLRLQVPAEDEDVMRSIIDTTMRKLEFLRQKAPEDPTKPGIYESDWEPSSIELEEFAELVTAVDQPVESLERMLAGAANPNIAEAIREVYPSLYAEAQQTLMDSIIETRESQPFDRRIELSLMFEVATDETMRPQFLSQLQAGYVGDEEIQEPEQPQPPSPSLAANVNAAQREGLKTTRIAGGG